MFLNMQDRHYFITGVANKKSIAYFVAKGILEQGGKVTLSIQTEQQREKVSKLFPACSIYVCDVEDENSFKELQKNLEIQGDKFDGLLHSIAFANFSDGIKPFHETKTQDFLQATNISCFSIVNLANTLKVFLKEDASVVALSISNTTAVSYGYLGPIKAALEHVVIYLAKSFSEFSQVRFNSVCAGPLKTSASAGIPGYVNNYLYAEKLTLRKAALKTQEVANTALFLLSPTSSGINATGIKVDCGMSCNYFDQDIVNKVMD